jgi:hypothetical protein
VNSLSTGPCFVAPQRGYDEPGILFYAISSFCPTSADGLHLGDIFFVWLFHGPWLAFKRAVDVEDWPSAGTSLNRIRQIIRVNLPLGLVVVVMGGSGRYWG